MEEQIVTFYAENKKGIKPGKQVDHRFMFSRCRERKGGVSGGQSKTKDSTGRIQGGYCSVNNTEYKK